MNPLNGLLLVLLFITFYNQFVFVFSSRLDSNSDADVEDLRAQKKKLEEVVQPIVAKLYADGKGEGSTGEDPSKDEL